MEYIIPYNLSGPYYDWYISQQNLLMRCVIFILDARNEPPPISWDFI
jgi:hypothetical protein